MKTRKLAIGDIHGNAVGLLQVLERCGFNPESDQIIQLGDVADGWSGTSECVDILLNIKKESVHEPVFIRGNHDVWVYDWMMYGVQPSIWTQQGGAATIDSYIKSQKLADGDHKNFWFNQKDWYIDEEDRIFIHAGWDYRSDSFPSSANYSVNAGSIAKECHWDRSLLQGIKSSVPSQNPFNATKMFKEVYIGHTATKTHSVENYGNLWNMDSGSGWYGRLAIMDIETKEVWYSDFTKELYPNEKGR